MKRLKLTFITFLLFQISSYCIASQKDREHPLMGTPITFQTPQQIQQQANSVERCCTHSWQGIKNTAATFVLGCSTTGTVMYSQQSNHSQAGLGCLITGTALTGLYVGYSIKKWWNTRDNSQVPPTTRDPDDRDTQTNPSGSFVLVVNNGTNR